MTSTRRIYIIVIIAVAMLVVAQNLSSPSCFVFQDGQRNVEDTDNNSAHVRDSLASTAYPLANPKPGFSLLGDRGVVAGTCADIGWNYVFSYAEDIRSQKWDLQALKSHRTQGVATKLCGYGYDKYFDGARGYTMLDIGANMGLSLMPYYSKGWKVVAFEPIKDNINTLRRNLFINGITEDQVALVEGAVTNQSGILEIYAPRGRTDNTALSRKGSTLNVGGDVDVEKVTAIEIDTYINNAVSSDLRRNIMLVKIDTQGHELNVLQGMKSFLSAPPSNEDLGGWSFVVVAEYHVGLQKAAGHDPNEVLNFMRSLGYEVRCKLTDIDPILPPASPKCGDVIFSKGKPLNLNQVWNSNQ
ncbi:SAM-dependent methyltransferase [Skeletonema marinoi]|uniref:SAM-dependent methyltransferase n=1 Tax=Skeletonema marinoi TaxID=267567 RepID=A0AAD8YGP5_9STRA|nr:SAM-dependent methyltransferase [Skeletonema marinoi]